VLAPEIWTLGHRGLLSLLSDLTLECGALLGNQLFTTPGRSLEPWKWLGVK